MLAFARKKLAKWLGIVLLGFILIAMVVTGFGTGGVGGLGSLSGGGSQAGDTLATVEGKAIAASEVSDLVNRQYGIARQQRPTVTMAELLAEGLFEQTLNQLITQTAIEHYAGERGLVVSDRLIDKMIVNIPDFRNFTGQFDAATFRQVLESQNLTEARFRADIYRQLLQRQLLAPIAVGARVPPGIAREYANLLLERRRGTIGFVPTEALTAGINPTDAEIAAFYRANRQGFTLPERRVIRYALIGPEQVAQAGAATDAEIARVYDANRARFGARETRTLQQVVLQSERDARAFVQRVRSGTSFADAAAQAGFSASDIRFENQSREQFARATTPQVAAAGFAAAQGSVAGPVRSELGFHVVRVERIDTTPARSLESARPEIATFIERRKRVDALNDLLTRIEDQLADGASFEQIVRAERLAIVATPPITAAGRAVNGEAYTAPPELERLRGTAFDIDAEELEPVVETLEANSRYALLSVERVDPAAPPPLAQIRDRVRAALIQRRALERARQIADTIVRQANGGTPLATAFGQVQPRLPAPESVEMRRVDISQGGRQPPAALLTLFSMPQGRARIVPAPNRGGFFVVFHAQRMPGNAASEPRLIQSTQTQFNNTASEELAQQFARAVELRSEVTRDEDAIRRARAAAGGAAE